MTVVGVAIFVAVVLAAWSPRRVPPARRPCGGDKPVRRADPTEMARRVGSRLTGLFGLDPEPGRDLRTAAVLGVFVVLVPFGPLVAAAGAAAVALVGLGRARARRHRSEEEIRTALPDATDLLVTAVGAGLSATAAVAAVAAQSTDPVSERLGVAISHPAGPVEGLEEVAAEVGEPVRPLVRVLVDGIRHGAPLGPALAGVAAEARLARRRHAEIRARRTSVRLVFPLVVCLLPAFALLTVAPALLSSLDVVVG